MLDKAGGTRCSASFFTIVCAMHVSKMVRKKLEERFEGLVLDRWVRDLCEALGLGGLEPAAETDVPRSRPKGLDAAKVVRELREKRVKESNR